MHLLDLVSHCGSDRVRTLEGDELPGAGRFAGAVRSCPIRYVLADGLARCAMQMAFADGDRLSSCLDLIRVPARSLWIEWTDAARQIETFQLLAGDVHEAGTTQRAGVLVSASADGRSGSLRSFWSTRQQQVYCSPLAAYFDLDSTGMAPATHALSARGGLQLEAPAEFGLDNLLGCLRFQYDRLWAQYYDARCETAAAWDAVARANLRGCAFDAPLVFAFLLMLSARGSLPRERVDVDRLNAARRRAGKAPLLEHVVVAAPLESTRPDSPDSAESGRSGPRMHHVCGHLVRRGAAVFWRVAHLRGCARLGQVRTRTVELSF